MRRFIATLIACLTFLIHPGLAQETPPQSALEAYGKRPKFRSISLSPSGEKIAMIAEIDGKSLVLTHTEAEGTKALIDVSSLQGNNIDFITEEELTISGYRHTNIYGYRGDFNFTATFTVNLKTGKMAQLLSGNKEDLYPAQSGVGRIIGRLDKTGELLMPAYTGRTDLSLGRTVFRIKPGATKGFRFKRGSRHTLDWLIHSDGTIIAREDMNEERNVYQVLANIDGKQEVIYKTSNDQPPFSLLATTPDGSALLISGESSDGQRTIKQLALDGTISEIDYVDSEKWITRYFIDERTKAFLGVAYAGASPEYDFVDKNLDAAITALTAKIGDQYHLVDHNDDKTILLIRHMDSLLGHVYLLYNSTTDKVNFIARAYPEIEEGSLGPVLGIEYKARDGLTIPAVLTLPAGYTFDQVKNRPAIIMPHGGPRSHTTVDFHWLPQYFANRGYLILQPNFRGSTGFGVEHMYAGDGEWGGKMQDDVTDGLEALRKMGLIDPDRTCIVGWSYGGYSALAGGAFTPEKYACVAAIAPVSDLPRTFRKIAQEGKKSSTVYSYWSDLIGDPKTQKDLLKERSPVNYAENFQAPVLLIHGEDDEVVDVDQSRVMERALKKAGKEVTFIKVKDEGHSMLESENRVEMLRNLSDFVEANIGN